MASAKGRVLTSVRGSIENAAEHWGQTRNGKQILACRRTNKTDWSPKTEAQKAAIVNFFNNSRISRIFAIYIKDAANGTSILTEKFGETATLKITAILQDVAPGTLNGAQDFLEWFRKTQTPDENGTIEHPGAYAVCYHELIPCISESRKQDFLEDLGLQYFEPTAAGHAAFKASSADSTLTGFAN